MESWPATNKTIKDSFWSRHRKRLLIWGTLAIGLFPANVLLHHYDTEARKSLLFATLKSLPPATDREIQVNSELQRHLGDSRIIEATDAAKVRVSNVVVWDGKSQTLLRIAQFKGEKPSLFSESLEVEYDHEGVLYTKRWTCVYVFGFWLRLFPRTQTAEADNLGASSDLEPAEGVKELRIQPTNENGWTVWDLPQHVRLRMRPDTREFVDPRSYSEVEILQDGRRIWGSPLDTTVWSCPMEAKDPWTRELGGGTIQIIVVSAGLPGSKTDPAPRLNQFLVHDGEVRRDRFGPLTSVGDLDGDGHEEICVSTAYDRKDCLGSTWYQPMPCYGNSPRGYEIDTPSTIKTVTLNSNGWHGFEPLCTEEEARRKSP